MSQGPIPSAQHLQRHGVWVESDQQKDAARALEALHSQLIAAVIDPYSWKWVLITLYHAVQAFVVASLDGGAPPSGTGLGDGTLQPHFGPDHPGRSPDADPLRQRYERMKSKTGFAPRPEVDEDMVRLGQYRSALELDLPTGWVMQVKELPGICRSALRVIEHLGWNPGRIPWQRESLIDLARVKHLASMNVLDALDRQYQNKA
jgi:hypothetical protein